MVLSESSVIIELRDGKKLGVVVFCCLPIFTRNIVLNDDTGTELLISVISLYSGTEEGLA
jgi:hypothetical protein